MRCCSPWPFLALSTCVHSHEYGSSCTHHTYVCRVITRYSVQSASPASTQPTGGLRQVSWASLGSGAWGVRGRPSVCGWGDGQVMLRSMAGKYGQYVRKAPNEAKARQSKKSGTSAQYPGDKYRFSPSLPTRCVTAVHGQPQCRAARPVPWPCLHCRDQRPKRGALPAEETDVIPRNARPTSWRHPPLLS